MCLHDNGSISVRVRRRNNSVAAVAAEGHGAFGIDYFSAKFDRYYIVNLNIILVNNFSQFASYFSRLCFLLIAELSNRHEWGEF